MVDIEKILVLQSSAHRLAKSHGVGWTEIPVRKYFGNLEGRRTRRPFHRTKRAVVRARTCPFLRVEELETIWFMWTNMYAYHENRPDSGGYHGDSGTYYERYGPYGHG